MEGIILYAAMVRTAGFLECGLRLSSLGGAGRGSLWRQAESGHDVTQAVHHFLHHPRHAFGAKVDPSCFPHQPRPFDSRDLNENANTVVVNSLFVDRILGGRNAVGQQTIIDHW